MIRVVVDNRVRVSLAGLDPELADEVRKAFTHRNPQREAKKAMRIPLWWKEPEEIPTHETIRMRSGEQWLTVPRGGFERVLEIIASVPERHEVEVIDRMESGISGDDIGPYRRELWEHQAEVVAEIVAHGQGIVRAGTGSGKTSAALAAIARLKMSSLVILPSTALLNQWQVRCVDELGYEPGFLGKHEDLRSITLGVWKSVENRLKRDASGDFRRRFGAIFLDECQFAPAGSFFRCVDPFPARVRIGVSADHRRKDGKEFLAHDLFGPVIHHVSHERVLKAGHIVDVETRLVPTDFRADWYGIPTDEEAEKKLDFVRLVKEMMADADREAIIDRCVGRELERPEPPTIIVMAHEVAHCLTIARRLGSKGIPAGLLVGEAGYESEFYSTLDGLARGALHVGVGTYKSIGTGVDLPSLTAIVAATPIAGNEQFFGQVRGRACRRDATPGSGKRNARLYIPWDMHVYPRHGRNVVRWNKSTVVWDERASSWLTLREWERSRAAA